MPEDVCLSALFLGVLRKKAVAELPPSSLTRCHLPLRGRLSQLTVTPRLPPRGSWHGEAVTEGVLQQPDFLLLVLAQLTAAIASRAAFCRSSIEIVQRAIRSASEPSEGMSATSARVLPLR